MFKKLIDYFGGGTPLLPPFQQQLYAAGATYLSPDEDIRTYSTTFEIRRSATHRTSYSDFSNTEQQRKQDDLQSGFVRREAIYSQQTRRTIGHEIMLNNSSALLGNNVSPMLHRMHDELLLKSILSLDKLPLSDNDLVFITLSPDTLEHELVMRLPSHNIVFAFHPEPDSANKLIARCRQLRARGFRFAIDDFNYSADYHPLLGLVDYLRFDFDRMKPSELGSQLEQIPRLSEKALIAKNADTAEILEIASRLFFQHYQGGGLDVQTSTSATPKLLA
ncbi:MAG: hypothetical protein ABFE02_18030 [Sulfuricella sp.]